jgi:hypothetical protein
MSHDKETLGTETQGPSQDGVQQPGTSKRQAIFRLKREERPRYTVVSNEPLDDPKLSWGAKGLLTYMLSKPDNWEFKREKIMENSSDKEPTLRRIIKELKQFGYLKIVSHRDQNGHIFEWTTYVFERPNDTQEPVDNNFTPLVNSGGLTRCYSTTCGKTPDIIILSNTNTNQNNKNNNNKLKLRVDDYSQSIRKDVDKHDDPRLDYHRKLPKLPKQQVMDELAEIGYSESSCETILMKYGEARARDVLNYVKNRPNSVSDAKSYSNYLFENKIKISPGRVRFRSHPTVEETVIPKLRTEIPPESVDIGIKALDEIRNKLSGEKHERN